MKVRTSDVAMLLAFLVIVFTFALTYDKEILWIGHAIAGIFSLILAITVVLAGAMIVGRIKRGRGASLASLHKRLSTYLTLLIVGTFFYGVWARIAHGEPLFWQQTEPAAVVLQGWFGVVIIITAILQIVPCFIVKDKRKTRALHMIFGYALVILLVIQTFLGVEATVIETAGNMILMFPLLRGMLAFA